MAFPYVEASDSVTQLISGKPLQQQSRLHRLDRRRRHAGRSSGKLVTWFSVLVPPYVRHLRFHVCFDAFARVIWFQCVECATARLASFGRWRTGHCSVTLALHVVPLRRQTHDRQAAVEQYQRKESHWTGRRAEACQDGRRRGSVRQERLEEGQAELPGRGGCIRHHRYGCREWR